MNYNELEREWRVAKKDIEKPKQTVAGSCTSHCVSLHSNTCIECVMNSVLALFSKSTCPVGLVSYNFYPSLHTFPNPTSKCQRLFLNRNSDQIHVFLVSFDLTVHFVF